MVAIIVTLGIGVILLIGLSLASIFIPNLGNYAFGLLFLGMALFFKDSTPFGIGDYKFNIGQAFAVVGLGIITFGIFSVNLSQLANFTGSIVTVGVPMSTVGTGIDYAKWGFTPALIATMFAATLAASVGPVFAQRYLGAKPLIIERRR